MHLPFYEVGYYLKEKVSKLQNPLLLFCEQIAMDTHTSFPSEVFNLDL